MKSGTFQLEHWIDLVLVLLQKDLKVRYKATVLGYLWSVMHPLVLAMVFLFAFRVILKNGIPEYPLVLVSYAIACREYRDANQGQLVRAFLEWVSSEAGQDAAAQDAGSAPISPALRDRVQAVVAGIR